MQPVYANIDGAFGDWKAVNQQKERNMLAQMQQQQQQPSQNALASYGGGGGGNSEVGARLMSDLQRDLGLSPEQAAGIVGNLAHESGGFQSLQEINPTVEGSRGGYGYAQWTGPRRREFEAWSEANGADPTSYDANYGFLRHELTNTPESRVMNDLRTAQGAGDAATIFSNQFLRPGIPHMGNRLALANQYAG